MLIQAARTEARTVLRGGLLMGASAASTAGMAWLAGPIFASLQSPTTTNTYAPILAHASFSQAMGVIVLLVAVGAYTSHLGSLTIARAQQRVIRRLRATLSDRLLRVAPEVWHQYPPAELALRSTQELASLRVLLQLGFADTVRNGLLATALATVALQLDTRLATITLLSIVPIGAAAWLLARRSRRSVPAAQAGETGLTSLMAEQLSHLPVLRAYKAEPYAKEQLKSAAIAAEGSAMRAAEDHANVSPMVEVAGAVSAGLIAVAAGPDGLALPLHTAVSLFAALALMFRPLRSIASSISVGLGAMGSLDRLDELMALPLVAEASSGPESFGTEASLHDVTFAYGDAPLFDRLCFEVRADERVALVGASGSGKTTLLMLLAGLLEPSSGERTLDTLTPRGVPAAIAWMPQEPLLFADTLLQNIVLGRAEHVQWTLLWKCIDDAGLAPLVDRLPHGLDTWLGEDGRALSSGERQRVSLCRALYHLGGRPGLLLLDEPTSALDRVTEASILDTLESLPNLTWVMATHRLAALRSATRVVRIDGGVITDSVAHPAAAEADRSASETAD